MQSNGFRTEIDTAHHIAEFFLKPVVGPYSNASHAQDNDLPGGPFKRHLLRVTTLGFKSFQWTSHVRKHPFRMLVQGGCDDEGNGQGNSDDHQPLGVQFPGRHGQGPHDQAELAVIGQIHGGDKRGPGFECEPCEYQEVKHYFQRQQKHQNTGCSEPSHIRQSRQTDLQKKAHQQDILYAHERAGHLFGPGMRRHQHAQYKGA